jgi:hypothetical protein
MNRKSPEYERSPETYMNDVSRDHNCAPERIRTSDLWYRKPALYPLSYGGRGGLKAISLEKRYRADRKLVSWAVMAATSSGLETSGPATVIQ